MDEINLNCPCKSTACSVKGKCKRCFAKHRNTKTSCIKKAIENGTINEFCPKVREEKSFGICTECREIAEKTETLTFCQEYGHKIYTELNLETNYI